MNDTLKQAFEPVDDRPAPISIERAKVAIEVLEEVEKMVGTSPLTKHISWVREAVWAAAYPSSSNPKALLDEIVWSAEQAEG
jgi:hypothetical protein